MNVLVRPGGLVAALYDDAFDLTRLGGARIRRASHVEPDDDHRWWADLSRVSGPRLGPFAKRTEALAAEVAWLEQHVLNGNRAARTGVTDG